MEYHLRLERVLDRTFAYRKLAFIAKYQSNSADYKYETLHAYAYINTIPGIVVGLVKFAWALRLSNTE